MKATILSNPKRIKIPKIDFSGILLLEKLSNFNSINISIINKKSCIEIIFITKVDLKSIVNYINLNQ